ncbi:MAG: ATP-binding protein [Gammaproteobacteria bacterium]|nr:ATP-binding protein [Gammaproteobacteria bacterium]
MITHDEYLKQTAAISSQVIQQAKSDVAQSQQIIIEKAVQRAGIPERFICKAFDSYQATATDSMRAKKICQRYADNFTDVLKKGVCMVLTGQAGTGKTHLAISILSQVINNGNTGLFITVSEMLRAIRGTYSPASKKTEQQVFDDFILADLLVLDEVGVSIGDDEKRKAIIFDVINGRYNRMKPTIILGNLTPDEMEQYLGFRVWDRIKESEAPVISFDWGSYRRKQVQPS